ncbi:MAG: molybdenum cofactor guanylyltransferase [Nitrososphaerota archaeon]|nr:molybdenum cofactor guanylyltransferase [Nitrososphaerota archaeon]MDG7048864.1 molybdenum cofactor guanylyltransferase [Nitrososphaerota archaeon]MDG7051387.1 molybdenum cofactor guanylyltransferase [Nitrososphaerota archaeon]
MAYPSITLNSHTLALDYVIPVSIIVLSGGESRRFGGRKQMFMLGSKPMFQWVVDIATQASDDVIISIKDKQQLGGWNISSDVTVAIDGRQEYSPLIGTASAVGKAKYDYTVVVPADSPFITLGFIEHLYRRISSTDFAAVIPIWPDGQPEVIHAIYRTGRLSKACDSLIGRNSFDVKGLPMELESVLFMSVEEIDEVDRISLRDFDERANFLVQWKDLP